MPGNDLGDRVHNFFAQDNSSWGQHQLLGVDGNWPVLNSNFWVGSQKQFDVLNSSSRSYPSQNSEIDSGQASYPAHASNGVNFSHSNLRPDISKSQYVNQQQYSNGVVCGNHLYRNRQNEANFLAVDKDSDQRHLISSRGLCIQESQQASGNEQQEKASDRLETSIAPLSFDLFGGQPQMNHQQAIMLQALQCQQSGLNDMQQLQQQIMIRKMQEFQMQQQLKQLDLRPQDLLNQVPAFGKQTSGSQSPNLVNGTSNSDALQNPWTAESGSKWLSRGSSAMQGYRGLVFPPNLAETQHLKDLVPQQADHSLYGVPVSMGLTVNQYSQMVTDRSPQMTTFSNSVHGSQHNFLPDQIGGQPGAFISRPKLQSENIGHASSQSINTGVTDMGALQQVNLVRKNAPHQHFPGRQEELATQLETSYEKSARQVSLSPNEAVLDPIEEKILFGSDDNLWAAFGKSPSTGGEAGNLFDNGGLSNGFSSIQSGSWSALMQSAVAETSSSDIGPQEEWGGLSFHNTHGSSAIQPALMHNGYVNKASLPGDDVRTPSALNSGSVRSSEDINTVNIMGSNQLGHKFQNEPGIGVSTDTSQIFRQSLDEASKWSNRSPLQKSVAERNQIYGNASQCSLGAERVTEKVSATWVPRQTGTGPERSGWNGLEAVTPGVDSVLNSHEADLSQKFHNRLMVMQGGVHGSPLWNSISVTSSTDFGSVKVGNHLADKEILSLNDASALVANSCSTGVGDGTSLFVQNNLSPNNLSPNQRSAHPPAKFQGNEGLGRTQDQANQHNQGLGSSNRGGKDEVRIHDMEENSSESHRSNLSQHASGGFREVGLSDASDSRSLPPGEQKLTYQLASKGSAPCKFQYHPLGNLDEDVEPTFGLKHPTQVQASSLQNTHFGPSSHASRYSAVTDKGEIPKYNRGTNEEPSRGSFSGSAPRMYFSFDRPLDSYVPNKASSPSQNMLDLLHKVDQSRNDGVTTHLSSSDCHVSSQPPEPEKSDGSAGRIPHGQSSLSKGFGLQLGPPSECLHTPDLSLPSQNARNTANPMHARHADAEMGEKMLQTSSLQSLPFHSEESQYENDRSAGPGHPGDGNSPYKASGNNLLAYSSDTPYARGQLQNKQITEGRGKMAMGEQIDSSFSCNILHSMQRGSAETVLPDPSHNIRKDNLASHGALAGSSDTQERGSAATASTRDQIRSSQHFDMPGISRHGASCQVLPSIWNNIPSSQNPLGAQCLKATSHLSAQPQPNIVESSPHGDVNKGDHLSSELSANYANTRGLVDEEHRLKDRFGQVASFGGICSTSKVEESLGKSSSMKDNLEDTPANSASMQNDIEAFGRSLKPNVFSNINYALLNQMKALKDAQPDPSVEVSKRMKGPDNNFDVRHVHLKAEQKSEGNVGDTLATSTKVPPEDPRMSSFSSSSDIMQRNTSPHGNIAAQDIVVAGLGASQNNPSDCTTSVGLGNDHITPQMAPFWLNQYGPSTNGQMLPMYNAREAASLSPDELPSTLKSSSILDAPTVEENSIATAIDACQVGGTLKSAPTFVSHEHLSSAQQLQLDVTGQHQVLLRPQKRKSATSERHPWHREISDGSQVTSVFCAAGDWNKAANCLMEKVQDDVELLEDGSTLLRSKRRIILTTQLMQQLFCPPPATILSADATSTYESVTYAVCRVTSGDACCAVTRSSDLVRRDCLDLHSMKGKLIGNPRSAKVIEELLGKARILDDDFLRLDKSTSILDLRVECQDLEKFSVINRFAKFHGYGRTDNAEASSIDVTAAAQNPYVQRYVTALPMPRNLPDTVQCLSL